MGIIHNELELQTYRIINKAMHVIDSGMYLYQIPIFNQACASELI